MHLKYISQAFDDDDGNYVNFILYIAHKRRLELIKKTVTVNMSR